MGPNSQFPADVVTFSYWKNPWWKNFILFCSDFINVMKVSHRKARSSRPEVFFKKGVLRNSAKFTGNHLRQSLFLIKLQVSACNFIKKEAVAQVFSSGFYEITKNTFFSEHLRWLHLKGIQRRIQGRGFWNKS